MRYIWMFLTLLTLCLGNSFAQNGTSMTNAVRIPEMCNTVYEDYRINDSYHGYSNHYGDLSPDVWFRFDLTRAWDIDISLCYSNFDTKLYLLDSSGGLLASDDNGCGDLTSALVHSVSAGTYYIVAEGSGSSIGELYFMVSLLGNTLPSDPGTSMAMAISAGSFNATGSFTDTRNNTALCGENIGFYSPDIYYKFILTAPAQVAISHCGSGIDTYMRLLNAYGDQLDDSDDSPQSPCAGGAAYIQTTLPAGTYYVVSEGYDLYTGSIVTSITVGNSPQTPSLSVSYPSSNLLRVGDPVSITPVITGGSLPQTSQFTVSPALPQGLVLNQVTGVISGTPLIVAASSSYTITLSSSSPAVTANLSIEVLPPNANVIPSSDQNYILTYTPRKPFTGVEDLSTKSSDDVMADVQYFDGLGRPLQTVQVKASPQKRDIVLPLEYDPYGREVKKYLPYVASLATSNGSYKTTAVTDLITFYTNPDAQNAPRVVQTGFPYVPIAYESSPLNRIEQQGAPGDAWQPAGTAGAVNAGHTSKTSYGTNSAGEVPLWKLGTDGSSASRGTNYYGKGQLYKTTRTDENGNQNIEYKDKSGQVIMKSVQDSVGFLSTSYIYDNIGNLRYVVPPGMTVNSFNHGTAQFNQFCFGYVYDLRNRLVARKSAGQSDWTRMVYNKLDRVVASQDANQRALNKWTFTKYDAFGQIIMTGERTDSRNRDLQMAEIDTMANQWEDRNSSTGSSDGYTNKSYPKTWDKVYTVNYYDNYDFPEMPYIASADSIVGPGRIKGLLTGSKVRILGTNTMLWTVNYYDEFGRVRESIVQNHIGGKDRSVNSYSFIGEHTKSVRTHSSSFIPALQIATSYTYDHVGRKIDTWHQVGSGSAVLLSRLNYNEIGQLKERKLHSTDGASFLETINYKYNPRGWQKEMVALSGRLSETLYYETTTLSGASPSYNGNISEVWYNTPNAGDKRFFYLYDKRSQLRRSRYYAGVTYDRKFDETIDYNSMGNITRLVRGNAGNLSFNYAGTFKYTYDGNRTSAIKYNDLTYRNYEYDFNGNTVNDLVIRWTYNYLNLPDSAVMTTNTSVYQYTAGGQKLSKKVIRVNPTVGTNTDHYVGGIEYTNSVLTSIPTDEGRYEYTLGKYQYNLTDHLGNVRVMITEGSSGSAVEQENEYYALGFMVPRKVISQGKENRYLYNGKELQPELSAGQYDYGARFYNPVIGRWNVVDPLAEKYLFVSPYVYVANNPLKYIDPDGRKIIIAGDKAFKQTVLTDLQKLTNQRLVIRNGSIKFRGTPSGGEKPIGTDLIRGLLKTDKIITILETSGGNTTIAINGVDANATKNGNGPGTGSTIEYNPNAKGEGIVNVDGSTGRPAEIGLAHELVHAERNEAGSRDMSIDVNKTDPDSERKGILTKNEIKVREKDSKIRKEQGVVERKQPY